MCSCEIQQNTNRGQNTNDEKKSQWIPKYTEKTCIK